MELSGQGLGLDLVVLAHVLGDLEAGGLELLSQEGDHLAELGAVGVGGQGDGGAGGDGPGGGGAGDLAGGGRTRGSGVGLLLPGAQLGGPGHGRPQESDG